MIGKRLTNHHVVCWGMFVLAMALRGWGLARQPPLADEVAAAFYAANYMDNGILHVMWNHPQLRNVVIFLSGELFGGYTAWGLRFGSVFFGSLTVPFLGYLAHSLFRNKTISYLAMLFLCIDPLHIMESREAFQETTTCFFIVAGVLAAHQGIRKECAPYSYLSGLLFGLATASKWHGLFPLFISAAAYLFAPWLVESCKGERRILPRLFTVLAAYVAIPLAVYVAVYLPWLHRGYSLPELARFQFWLVKHQYNYKSVFYDENFLPHRAYQWFLWPVGWADFVFYQGKPYVGIAMGNFLVWGLTLPSLWFAVKCWLKRRSFAIGYVVAIFLMSYLPLVLTSRSIYVFAAPAVIPFAFILSAYAVSVLLECGKLSGKGAAAYLAMVILLSALMYPMSTFRTLEYPYLRPIAEMYSSQRPVNQ